jgi:hypothetical protein
VLPTPTPCLTVSLPRLRGPRRLLPVGWTVIDDASNMAGAPCCPRVDDEGVRARPVKLVDDGLVVTRWMSRTPNEHFAETTGHASHSGYGRCVAKASGVIIKSPRQVGRVALHRAAAKHARHQKLDRYPVLAGENWGLGTWHMSNGTTQPVRGLNTREIDARSLRTIELSGTRGTAHPFAVTARSARPSQPLWDLFFRICGVEREVS